MTRPDRLPQAQRVLYLCPTCNAVLQLPARRTPDLPRRRRLFLRCTSCHTGLTLAVPPGRRRIPVGQIPYMPRRLFPNTLAAYGLPRFAAGSTPTPSHFVLHPKATAAMVSARDWGLAIRRPDFAEVQRPRRGFEFFPHYLLVETMAFLVPLRLGLVDTVLATLVIDREVIFAAPPSMRALEPLLATLVAIALPPRARPLPPAWAFDSEPLRRRRLPHREHPLTFQSARQRYAWHRAGAQAVWARQPDLLRRTWRAMLRRWIPAFEPLRPLLQAHVRTLRACDYRFHPAVDLPGPTSAHMGWECWETCCPGVRLDVEPWHLLHRFLAPRAAGLEVPAPLAWPAVVSRAQSRRHIGS